MLYWQGNVYRTISISCSMADAEDDGRGTCHYTVLHNDHHRPGAHEEMRNAINNMDKYDTKFTILVGGYDIKIPLYMVQWNSTLFTLQNKKFMC